MKITEINSAITGFIWQSSAKKLPSWKTRIIKVLRILYATIFNLSDGQLSLRAMSLVYTTLLSLVPLLAISFSVLKGFGVHNQLEPALLHLLAPMGDKSTQITNQIIAFVDNTKVGALGTFGLLILIFTVLSLVKKIESAFNFTWKISTTRRLTQRFSNYLSVIMVGPVLIFSAIGMTATINNSTIVNDILIIEPFGSLILFIGKLIPFFLTIAVFTFIYLLVPNTKVKIKSALTGAISASVFWKITSWIFTAFIVNSTNYTAIYSSFAILIIFMLWIYTTWLILLTGASIAFYHQHPERTNNRQQSICLSCRLREKLALTIMQKAGNHFYHNKIPWSALRLSKLLDISEQAILPVIAALEKAHLLVSLDAKKNTFIPAQSLENISIYHVISAIRQADETPYLHPDEINSGTAIEDIITQIDGNIKNTLSKTSIKDIVQESSE